MRKQTLVVCEYCITAIFKDDSEVVRSNKLGRKFFCDNVCSASYYNEPKKNKHIELTCPCGNKFPSHTGNKAPKHCSISCASKYSMTDLRKNTLCFFRMKNGKNTKNLLTAQEVLKSREMWKYVELITYLQTYNKKFEFEYKINNYIYDLYLFDSKIIIEFDGTYHCGYDQQLIDDEKDKIAISNGFRIFRIKVKSNEIIQITPELKKILDTENICCYSTSVEL